MSRRSPRSPQPHALGTGSRRFVLYATPALLAALLYLPAVDYEWVWDDSIVLGTQMPLLQGLQDVLFPPDRIPQWPYGYYRPVLTASYLVDLAVFGEGSTRGPHATVILLHVLCTIFVTYLATLALRRFRYRWWGALAGGLLFAAHPIHTESVCWITGRSDVLATVFVLPALALAIRYRDRRSKWALWASPLLFLLSALSKEVGLAMLALLPLWIALVPEPDAAQTKKGTRPKAPKNIRKRLRSSSPLFALCALAAMGYFLLRAVASVEGAVATRLADGVGTAMARGFSALAFYVWKVLFPPPQSALVTSLPGALYTVAVLGAALGATVWVLLRFQRGDGLWLLALGSFGLCLLPFLPVAFSSLAEAPVAERYLYLPSIGLSLAVGGLFCRSLARPPWRHWVATATALVVFLAATGTAVRSRVWRDDIALWTATLERQPDSGLAWGELGKAYLDRGVDLDRALDYFQRAVEKDNDRFGRSIAYNSMGIIHAKAGRSDEALEAWKAALAQRPDYPSVHYNLGNLLAHRWESQARLGRLDLALLEETKSHLKEAVALNPRYRKAWLRLVWCDVQKAAYLLRTGGSVEQVQGAIADAEESRAVLAEIDADGSDVRRADNLIQPAKRFLGSRSRPSIP